MPSFLHRHILAIACVAAPLIFGVLGTNLTIAWLTGGTKIEAIKLDYRLRDSPSVARPKTAADAARPATSTPGGAAPVGTASKNEFDPSAAKLDLVAHHVSGLINFALVSIFLYFEVAAAVAIGAVILWQRAGRTASILVPVGAGALAVTMAHLIMAREERRFLLVDNIFRLADAHELLKQAPVLGRVIALTEINVAVGMFGFVVLIAVLYVASIRNAETDRNDLLSRVFVIRLALFVSSAGLVLIVLLARALVDWPLGLLIDADRTALATAAAALTRFWGTMATLAIIAAFAPATASWCLDRMAYRAKHPPAEAGRAGDDGLEIAPRWMMTGVAAIVAPVIVSPLADALKLLLSAVSN